MTTATTHDDARLWDFLPMLANRARPAQDCLASPLLDLMRTSNVNKIPLEQVEDAHSVLHLRKALLAAPGEETDADGWQRLAQLQRRIVERHLDGRAAYYGPEQCAPLPDAETFAREGRDTFLIIKFMDEAPHIEATLTSLLTQTGVDLNRVVIVAVDNNSTDGSGDIVRATAASVPSAARVVCINQSTPGGGSAARYGVDRSIATIHAMCLSDGQWGRLQSARIAVSDGDTVYHHQLVHGFSEILDKHQDVDGVMPFLTYKFTAALRFFADHQPHDLKILRAGAATGGAIPVTFRLSDISAFERLPRAGRRKAERAMRLSGDGIDLSVPLDRLDGRGRRYGVIEDPAGARAYVMEDRTIVLDRAPVSGFDSALLFLENGGVRADEKWRWHSVIGHDLFLLWMFQRMGIPEAVVAPDTSDALKVFRCWSFAIGGQHQLSSPALKIVTGTDYQSGRVQQAVGCRTVLGPATAYTETEVDRLAKMIRNFANRQGVFYGDTRSRGLERASGLYLHMTRIQDQVESEIRGYSEDFFRDVVFPERVLFPLRWLLQNAICLYAGGDRSVRTVVRERVFAQLLGSRGMDEALAGTLGDTAMAVLAGRSFEDKRDEAESLAEELISGFYPEIMRFYARTLADFLDTQGVARADYAWLLEDVEHSRNALIEKRAPIDPAVVWAGREFVIDHARGQVVGMQDGGR